MAARHVTCSTSRCPRRDRQPRAPDPCIRAFWCDLCDFLAAGGRLHFIQATYRRSSQPCCACAVQEPKSLSKLVPFSEPTRPSQDAQAAPLEPRRWTPWWAAERARRRMRAAGCAAALAAAGGCSPARPAASRPRGSLPARARGGVSFRQRVPRAAQANAAAAAAGEPPNDEDFADAERLGADFRRMQRLAAQEGASRHAGLAGAGCFRARRCRASAAG
jgi:hypothetical protein